MSRNSNSRDVSNHKDDSNLTASFQNLRMEQGNSHTIKAGSPASRVSKNTGLNPNDTNAFWEARQQELRAKLLNAQPKQETNGSIHEDGAGYEKQRRKAHKAYKSKGSSKPKQTPKPNYDLPASNSPRRSARLAEQASATYNDGNGSETKDPSIGTVAPHESFDISGAGMPLSRKYW